MRYLAAVVGFRLLPGQPDEDDRLVIVQLYTASGQHHLLLSSFQTKWWQATYVKCMLSSLPLLQDGPHNL